MADQPSQSVQQEALHRDGRLPDELLDSELVVAKLRNEGYELTDDLNQADPILYNTCSVRQHAEDKIYSALGRIKRLKERKPELTIGVLGCMAQKDQEQIFRRAPHVDVVVGPGQLAQGVASCSTQAAGAGRAPDRGEPGADSAARSSRRRPASRATTPIREPAMRPSPFQAFVRVMMGCDKFCTYCIVPSVRGPEQSRPPDVILDEARHARRPGGQGDHAAGPDRQQLQVPRARRPRRSGSPTCSSGCTTSTASSGSSSSPTSPTT